MEYDFSKYSEKQLVDFITDIFDIETVPAAIRELRDRNSELAMQLSKNILENDIGDRYLQASVIDSIFDRDNQYVLNFFLKNINHLDYYVFGEIIECFSIEVYQPFGQLITKDIVEKVEEKYNNYSPEEGKKIEDQFQEFEKSFKTSLLK